MDDPNPRRTRLIDLLCLALLGGSALWLLLRWNTIPARVPGHYGIGGLPDRWTGKASLWSLPAVGAVLYALLHTAEHFPALWNTGVPVTDQNRRRVYGILYGLLSTQKLLLCAVFAYLTLRSARASTLPGWFLPVFLLLVFGSLTRDLVRLFRAR